jgi:hypothetical protein
MMEVTLHVDLLWTDLEDFVEHFERELQGASVYMLLGKHAGWILFNDEPYPENPGFKGWELIDGGNYTRISVFIVGSTSKNYFIAEGTKDGPEALRAIVGAARYRRDRLKVVVSETEAWGYRERLLEWLRQRWGEGIELLEETDAPVPPDSKDYKSLIRNAGYAAKTAKERWQAIVPIYAEWRRTEPGRATHKQLAEIMGCGEQHVKRMWKLYKPYDRVE